MESCDELLKLEQEIDEAFFASRPGELKKKLNEYRAMVNLLLNEKVIVNKAINKLIEDVERIDDPDHHDYWWAGWRYVASIVGMLCGEAPYFGSGSPTEEFGEELVKTLWELPCRAPS